MHFENIWRYWMHLKAIKQHGELQEVDKFIQNLDLDQLPKQSLENVENEMKVSHAGSLCGVSHAINTSYLLNKNDESYVNKSFKNQGSSSEKGVVASFKKESLEFQLAKSLPKEKIGLGVKWYSSLTVKRRQNIRNAVAAITHAVKNGYAEEDLEKKSDEMQLLAARKQRAREIEAKTSHYLFPTRFNCLNKGVEITCEGFCSWNLSYDDPEYEKELETAIEKYKLNEQFMNKEKNLQYLTEFIGFCKNNEKIFEVKTTPRGLTIAYKDKKSIGTNEKWKDKKGNEYFGPIIFNFLKNDIYSVKYEDLKKKISNFLKYYQGKKGILP